MRKHYQYQLHDNDAFNIEQMPIILTIGTNFYYEGILYTVDWYDTYDDGELMIICNRDVDWRNSMIDMKSTIREAKINAIIN